MQRRDFGTVTAVLPTRELGPDRHAHGRRCGRSWSARVSCR